MTTTTPVLQCGLCGAELRDTYLCGACTGRLAADLRDSHRAGWDLEVSYSRQDVRSTGRDGGHQKAKASPLPWNEMASQLLTELRRLTGQIGAVTHVAIATTDPDTIARMLAGTPDGPRLADILARLMRSVDAVIDRKTEPWLYGPCTCGTDLWDRPDAARVVCPQCNASFDGPGLKTRQWEAAQTMLVTQAEAATLMAVRHGAERDRCRKSINQWVSRGRLEVLAERVRFGDVDRLWREAAARRVPTARKTA